MLSDLNKPQKIFMIILYCVTAITTLLGVFAIYNITKIKKPWTLGVTYAYALETAEGQKEIISVGVYENNNNNGVPIYDMRINSYADTEGNGLRGFGIQCVGDWKIVNKSDYTVFASSGFDTGALRKDANNLILTAEEISQLKTQFNNKYFEDNQTIAFGDFYFYYTGNDGKVYSKTTIDKFDNEMLIDIDGEFYRLTLRDYSYERLNVDGNNLFVDGWNLMFNTSKTETSAYTWFEIFDLVMRNAINTNVEDKYSKFALPLQDFSEFVVLEYQDSKGQYHELDKTSESRNYFTIQVDFNNNGATKSSDSMFGMIYGSGSYDYYSDTTVNDYWNAYSELTLTEKNINFVYNTDLKAYYVSIDKNFSEYLQTLNNAEISIELDLTKTNNEIYGIDLQYFNFDIESFSIKLDSIEDFKIYNQEACGVTPTLIGV